MLVDLERLPESRPRFWARTMQPANARSGGWRRREACGTWVAVGPSAIMAASEAAPPEGQLEGSLLSTYWTPGIAHSALDALFHFILGAVLQGFSRITQRKEGKKGQRESVTQ